MWSLMAWLDENDSEGGILQSQAGSFFAPWHVEPEKVSTLSVLLNQNGYGLFIGNMLCAICI